MSSTAPSSSASGAGSAPPRRRFAGKSVIVTGSAMGIGQGIAEAFLEEGANVAVVDRETAAADAWVGEWASSHADWSNRAVVVPCDISKEEDVAKAVSTAAATFGGLDVLVNNAAAFVYGTVETVTESDWDRVLSVNVKGAAFATKHALPLMRERIAKTGAPGPNVVNISSISAFTAQEHFLPYSTTKAAILQMTRNIAIDVGKDGIRVNAVCPGPILTEATTRHAKGVGKTLEEVVADLTGHLILKRMGRVSEVASAVLFLASDDASFTTGNFLMVDGGYLLV
jgi:NAD(P)-dependent dehydrogenase (short-subunit alcohol dehydrogenase family)